MAFVCLLEIHLHLHGNDSLKGKRRELSSLKAQLRQRFGAAVSETADHDVWQRATLSAALVGPDATVVEDAAAKLSRFVESRFPDGVRIDRGLASSEEVLGG